jgi:hypothetical protein
METYSLNEIEAMGKKATKGAGFHWGHAEEAGKAVRWLAQRNFPGPELLASKLLQDDGIKHEDPLPIMVAGVWRVKFGRLCPIIMGSIMCDLATQFASDERVDLGPIAYPLLLTPFVAAVSELTNNVIQLSWEGVMISITPNECAFEGEYEALTVNSTDFVTCRCANLEKPIEEKLENGRPIDPASWVQLNAFAYRTYAPATEASRLSGAGAGVSDND